MGKEKIIKLFLVGVFLVMPLFVLAGCASQGAPDIQQQPTAQERAEGNSKTADQLEIEKLKSEIESLKNQEPKTITKEIIREVPKPVTVDNTLKIEQCRAMWIDSDNFPGTIDEFKNLITITNKAVEKGKANGDTYDSMEILDTLESDFRDTHYQECLKK